MKRVKGRNTNRVYAEWINHVRVDEQDDKVLEQDQSCRDNGMQGL